VRSVEWIREGAVPFPRTTSKPDSVRADGCGGRHVQHFLRVRLDPAGGFGLPRPAERPGCSLRGRGIGDHEGDR
jgi:hypothetical protein